MLLKSPRLQIVESRVEVMYRFWTLGKVMWMNFWKALAPSTSAASYRSLEIVNRPETMIRVQNGRYFQIWTTMMAPRARFGSSSQFGPSIWKYLNRMLLIMPHSALSIQRNDRIVGIDGIAQGRMKMKLTQRTQRAEWTKNPDSNRARTILTLTPSSRNSAVLTNVLR